MNKFQQAIANKEFLITAEVTPPKGGNPQRMLEVANLLKNRVHAVNVTDGSRAVLRMSSIAACVLLLQNKIEPICQVTGRDRNSISIQGDLMGAYSLGIRNILSLTGDPVKAGDHPQAKAVFELESVRILRLIAQLNQGFDLNKKSLPDGNLDLYAGAAIDPQSPSWSGLQKRFEQKMKAGAKFYQSQLITDFDKLDKFMTEIASECNQPILAGIFLLKSGNNARFINKNVPGVEIPEEIIKRLDKAENSLEEGVKIAAEQVKLSQQICQGVHLMAVKREDLIPQILDLAGIESLNYSTMH